MVFVFDMLRSVPRVVFLIVAAHSVTDLSQGALLVALPYFKAKFALSYTQVSAIALLQNLTSSVIQPVFGYYSDKNHRPWLMAAGCAVSGLAMLGSLLAPNYYILLLCTVVSGLGIAAFHPEGAKTVNRLSGAGKGKGVSMFVVGGNAGFALGSLFMGFLLTSVPEGMFWLYLIPFLGISIPLYRMAMTLPRPESKAAGLGDLKCLISVPLAALLGVVLVRATVSAGISTFIPLYYVSYLSGNAVYASWLLTVFLAGGALGTLCGGILSDRYGSKRIMLWSILPISLLLVLFQSMSGVWVFIVLALASAFLSAAFAGGLVLAQCMMPGNVGMASGLTIGFSVGLGGMGVLLLGRIADLWSLPLVFDLLAILPVVGFVCTFFVRDVVREREPQISLETK